MNAERKRLVQQTWEMVARDHRQTATVFYDRLFEIDAPARVMFAQTDMAAQRTKFVAMMGDIVAHLDLPAALIPSLSSLGRRHREYGVRQIDYDRVREAPFGAPWPPGFATRSRRTSAMRGRRHTPSRRAS